MKHRRLLICILAAATLQADSDVIPPSCYPCGAVNWVEVIAWLEGLTKWLSF